MNRGRLILLALGVSATLNLAMIGGYAYQRWVAAPHTVDVLAVKALGLKPDQLAALKELRRSQREQVAVAWKDAEPRLRLFGSMIAEAEPDDPRIARGLQEMQQRRTAVQTLLINQFLDWRKSLDPNQQQRLKEHLADVGFARRLLGLAPAADSKCWKR